MARDSCALLLTESSDIPSLLLRAFSARHFDGVDDVLLVSNREFHFERRARRGAGRTDGPEKLVRVSVPRRVIAHGLDQQIDVGFDGRFH